MQTCLLVSRSAATAARFRSIAADAEIDVVGVRTSFIHDAGRSSATPLDVLALDVDVGAQHCLRVCKLALADDLAKCVVFLGPRRYDGVREALESGATGFLCIDSDREFLESALRAVTTGQTVLDPQVTAPLLAAVLLDESTYEDLSKRELEVMRLVAQGESNKRIAKRLELSENTVKTYLSRAYRKLGCRSRSEAAAVVARLGLL